MRHLLVLLALLLLRCAAPPPPEPYVDPRPMLRLQWIESNVASLEGQVNRPDATELMRREWSGRLRTLSRELDSLGRTSYPDLATRIARLASAVHGGRALPTGGATRVELADAESNAERAAKDDLDRWFAENGVSR